MSLIQFAQKEEKEEVQQQGQKEARDEDRGGYVERSDGEGDGDEEDAREKRQEKKRQKECRKKEQFYVKLI